MMSGRRNVDGTDEARLPRDPNRGYLDTRWLITTALILVCIAALVQGWRGFTRVWVIAEFREQPVSFKEIARVVAFPLAAGLLAILTPALTFGRLRPPSQSTAGGTACVVLGVFVLLAAGLEWWFLSGAGRLR